MGKITHQVTKSLPCEVLPRAGVTMMLVYKSPYDEVGLCQWFLVIGMILTKWWSTHHHHPLDIIFWCPHGHNDGSRCWTQVTVAITGRYFRDSTTNTSCHVTRSLLNSEINRINYLKQIFINIVNN